jgi:thioredoxin reductase (NADPH)
MRYDLIVIGAGPAGISVAVYAASRGLQVLVLEKKKVGGIIGNVSTVTHYTAILPEETGATFAKRMEVQALSSGVEIRYEEVTEVTLEGKAKTITTNQQVYETSAVILANGSTPKKLNIPGESELAGKGIGLNAARDGKNYEGKDIYVVGGADGAIKEAIYLSAFAKKLTVIHFESRLGAIPQFMNKLSKLDNVEVLLEKRLTAVYGTDHVERLELTDEKTGTRQLVDDDGCGIFIYAGTVPNTQLYTQLDLAGGYISVNAKMETKIPGVYAAGDIRVKQVRQVATAVSDGAVAAINAAVYIKGLAAL